MNKSRGRPRGNPPTRARIAEAARTLFLERGYQGTTLRAVAAAAGVDQALVSYHFGSKQGLFGEVMRVHCAQSRALAEALPGDPAGLADRLLQAVVALWDDAPATGEPAPDDQLLGLVREYLDREVLVRLAEFLGGPDATERATAAVTVIGGLIYTRYLNPLPAASGLSAADVRRILGPALRAALAPRHRSGRLRPPVRGATGHPLSRDSRSLPVG
ncbi:TetR/AcrR family transcriptional regulator [Micromonospora purpureochromogenes]|uniref:AcrR family transcriptional regulator n=1 Tax=Micromonospora purpureochromogenes TaxID=47872 RepID=A0ABX2RTD6_9ACTN|nr:TetR/AcrR family transcriptional regulator [Micromonospora purpureochromogenes]NYF59476.1 AcrR family transcriptional regulator [Micromonospora purpureochromogenes]